MPGLAELPASLDCEGRSQAIPLAENAIDQYLAITPAGARGRGLCELQRGARGRDRGAALVRGDSGRLYIARKLTEERADVGGVTGLAAGTIR